jgi:ferredoxin-thioredoxin reductase catalytic subunit
MALSPEAQQIKQELDAYLQDKDFVYNPDTEVVDRVLEGMAKRKAKTGKAFCPCRLVSGNDEADAKIVCPCAFHEDEIREQGMCHCRLFVAKPGADPST